MRTASVLAALSFAATSYAQAVEIGIEPSSPAPKGCDRSPKGNFTIGYIPASGVARKRETAIADADGSLYLTLVDGVLTDGWDRTGSIVANHQFQFDGPPQAGAIYTGGFSVCQNKSLAIGGTTRWWNCLSGTFNNLYDEWIGDQCQEIRIVASFVEEPTSTSSSTLPSSTTAESSSVESSTAESTTVISSVSSDNGTTSTVTSTSAKSSSTLSAVPLTSINGTKPSGPVSRVSSSEPTATPSETGTPAAPDAPGAAAPSAVTQGATFGAVILFAAALML
ncbi:hypothetical protein BU23DRAFT_472190 [Bimuria novae-zelandiae CBS 107.79]|uniref:Cell wall mannoprotein PIR1-like C-terminal domain-containing protein n=1 Tax=Bimuria novae-zelandiae CBS 107.79 TaxID=1447943 RepID=A0A6A5V7F8_9PLEO|nr:hypothetical protein BU23DRAFT_472190 [Bimuria novae-zelandiae CBS 107.79]